jgi:hypothetical protein
VFWGVEFGNEGWARRHGRRIVDEASFADSMREISAKKAPRARECADTLTGNDIHWSERPVRNGGGETLILLDANGHEVDRWCYGEPWSLARQH